MEILADAALDLSPITSGLTAMIPIALAAFGTVAAAALGVVGFKWAAPQVAGFFKKNAK